MFPITLKFTFSGKSNGTYPISIDNHLIQTELNHVGIIASVNINMLFTKTGITGILTMKCTEAPFKSKAAYKKYFSDYLPILIKTILEDKFLTDVEVNQLYPAIVPDESEEVMIPGFNIKSSTLIIAITILNVALFIGGTVYSGIQIASIQKRYDDNIAKMDSFNTKFNDAGKKLYDAETTFKSKENDFDNLLTSLKARKTSIMDSVNTEQKNIEFNIDSANSKINGYNKIFENLDHNIHSTDDSLNVITQDMKNLRNDQVRIGFTDAWKHLRWYLMGVIILPYIFIAILFFVKKNRSAK